MLLTCCALTACIFPCNAGPCRTGLPWCMAGTALFMLVVYRRAKDNGLYMCTTHFVTEMSLKCKAKTGRLRCVVLEWLRVVVDIHFYCSSLTGYTHRYHLSWKSQRKELVVVTSYHVSLVVSLCHWVPSPVGCCRTCGVHNGRFCRNAATCSETFLVHFPSPVCSAGVPRRLLGSLGLLSNGNFTTRPASRKTRVRQKFAKEMFENTCNP